MEPLSIASLSVKKANVNPQDIVAVIGGGMIGLCIIKILKATGVGMVIAIERRSARLKAAKECGADLVIDANKDNPLTVIRKATSGLGVNTVFECARTRTSFSQALDMVRHEGAVIQVALYDLPFTWDSLMPTHKSTTVMDIQRDCFADALELISSGTIKTEHLISHKFYLKDVEEAFEAQDTAQDAIKVMLKI